MVAFGRRDAYVMGITLYKMEQFAIVIFEQSSAQILRAFQLFSHLQISAIYESSS